MGTSLTLVVRQNGAAVAKQVSAKCLDFLCQDVGFLAGLEGPAERWWRKATPGNLAPSEAGLVVVDRDTRWVGHLQSHGDPATMDAILLAYVFSLKNPSDDDRSIQQRWADAFAAGAFRRVAYRDGPPDAHRKDGDDLRSFLVTALAAHPDERRFGFILARFEPLGWSLENFRENQDAGSPRSWQRFVAALLDRGFEWSRLEDEAWFRYTHGETGVGIDSSEWRARRQHETLQAAVEAPHGSANRMRL